MGKHVPGGVTSFVDRMEKEVSVDTVFYEVCYEVSSSSQKYSQVGG